MKCTTFLSCLTLIVEVWSLFHCGTQGLAFDWHYSRNKQKQKKEFRRAGMVLKSTKKINRDQRVITSHYGDNSEEHLERWLK